MEVAAVCSTPLRERPLTCEASSFVLVSSGMVAAAVEETRMEGEGERRMGREDGETTRGPNYNKDTATQPTQLIADEHVRLVLLSCECLSASPSPALVVCHGSRVALAVRQETGASSLVWGYPDR